MTSVNSFLIPALPDRRSAEVRTNVGKQPTEAAVQAGGGCGEIGRWVVRRIPLLLPDPATRTLLFVIERNPKLVAEVVSGHNQAA